MNYVGDFQPGSNVFVWYNTFSSNDPSASVTTTNLIDTDVHIFKDDSLTQRTNAAGVAVDVDVDTYAGVHKITIDTADNTVADFYEAGHDYAVVVEGTTVDAGTVNACVGTFSIANRRVAGQMCSSSIEAYTDTTNFTLTTGEASANDDAYNGCTIIVTDQVTKIQKGVGHISDYTGATRAVVLHAAPLQTAFTWAVGDSVEIFATSALANVNTIAQGTQTANDNGADLATITGTAGAKIATDAQDLSASLDVNTKTITAGAVSATAIAAAAIDNATFAADVGSTAYATNIIALAVRKALDDYDPATKAEMDTAHALLATPAEVATELGTYDGPTKAEMDTAHALLATEAKQDTIDAVVDAIKAVTDAMIMKDTTVASVDTADTKFILTDALTANDDINNAICSIYDDTGSVWSGPRKVEDYIHGTKLVEIDANTPFALQAGDRVVIWNVSYATTAAAGSVTQGNIDSIADAVWDETLADHLTAATTGAKQDASDRVGR